MFIPLAPAAAHAAAGASGLIPIPHIPGYPISRDPRDWGYPQMGVPQIGPKSHSYIDAPDGRQCDLAHMSCSKGGPKHPILDPYLRPIMAKLVT